MFLTTIEIFSFFERTEEILSLSKKETMPNNIQNKQKNKNPSEV